MSSRRRFLQQVAVGLAMCSFARNANGAAAGATESPAALPWYRRTLRWGQTNLTEADPPRFNLAWWRDYWRRTAVQGLVVNAGGITAYYPTTVPLHRRAEFLGDRDLFGEITRAAHEDGLAVFARMDSNRAGEEFHRAHPDWFARDADGRPYLVTNLYQACVNSPYYDEHLPAILREVATKYRPEGFTDNNWNGPQRHQPCFCDNCERKFRARGGGPIPRHSNWNDAVYRDWIRWNYERRLEIWDRFNAITRAAGGPDCIWVGMMSGSQDWQARAFRDDREIYRRAGLVMLDDQRRHDHEGFQHNGEIGARIHGVAGWDKIVPESMAMYHSAEDNFRLAAKPPAEARMWVVEGFAGGIQPWWHIVGSAPEDRRTLETAVPLWRWHRDHEAFLVNRQPIAAVGLLWSQRNMDFFGRDDAGPLVDDPWNGFTQALVRARIAYVPVHVDDLATTASELGLKAIVLPNLAALSDEQLAAIRRFVSTGGGLLATGQSSLCFESGELRGDLALADLFGARVPEKHAWRDEAKRTAAAKQWTQTYLRLPPESAGPRHTVLQSFAGTDLLAFGGSLEPLNVSANAQVPLTFVPNVPVMPVEAAWMREPRTEIAGLILNERAGASGRVAYLPADLDRRFARDNLPDHGDLLAGLVRWVAREDLPWRVEGAGLVDCHLYRQENRLILHVVNLTSAGTWRTPVHELIAIGPLRVAVRTANRGAISSVRSLVSGRAIDSACDGDWIRFELAQVSDHEVVLIGE